MITKYIPLTERFDVEGFMAYLEKTFSGFENPFLRETIRKIVQVAHESSMGQLSNKWIAFYIKDHIADEVQLTEIMQFVK